MGDDRQEEPPGAAAAAEPCPARHAALPPELTRWAMPQRTVGETARLAPSRDVHYVTPAKEAPKETGGAPDYGGLFLFSAKVAGLYRVALGNDAWIDVLAGDAALPLAGEARGPTCSGIHKMRTLR